jgi:hypothetical protein
VTLCEQFCDERRVATARSLPGEVVNGRKFQGFCAAKVNGGACFRLLFLRLHFPRRVGPDIELTGGQFHRGMLSNGVRVVRFAESGFWRR